MQKMSTPRNKTDLITEKKRLTASQELQPQTATLQKIMQFASSYRAEKIADNQFVELFLN
jgi:aspartyl/asparaginyl-tRNA synthetase